MIVLETSALIELLTDQRDLRQVVDELADMALVRCTFAHLLPRKDLDALIRARLVRPARRHASSLGRPQRWFVVPEQALGERLPRWCRQLPSATTPVPGRTRVTPSNT